jgi:hypothetical protein
VVVSILLIIDVVKWRSQSKGETATCSYAAEANNSQQRFVHVLQTLTIGVVSSFCLLYNALAGESTSEDKAMITIHECFMRLGGTL